jgi:ribonuclease HI/exonuclease III
MPKFLAAPSSNIAPFNSKNITSDVSLSRELTPLQMPEESLEITCLNVQGALARKMLTPNSNVLSLFSRYSIIFLIDAGLDPAHLKTLPIPESFTYLYRQGRKRSKMWTGGILVCWKKSLPLAIHPSSNKFLVWAVLGGKTSICATYAPPSPKEHSRHQEDAWAVIRHLSAALKGQDDLPLLLMGDLNVRTGESNRHQPIIPHQAVRRSTDKKMSAGRKEDFLNLCSDLDVHILNGCLTPDFEAGGKPTHIHMLKNKQSTVTVIDYALASTELLESISSFSVADFIPESDHAAISVNISLPYIPLEQIQHCSFPSRRPRPHYAASSPLEVKVHNILQQKDNQQTYAQRLWQPASIPPTHPIIAYTDGSASVHARTPKAGSGVHFPEDPGKDISEGVPGAQTNNRAELFAILLAIEAADASRPLLIYSDSQHSIQSLCRWSLSWMQTGFSTKKWKVDNRDLMERTLAAVQRRPTAVSLHWVKGHSDNAGNDAADALAKAGQGKPEPPLGNLPLLPLLPHTSPILNNTTIKLHTSLQATAHEHVDLSDLYRPAERDLTLEDSRKAFQEAASLLSEQPGSSTRRKELCRLRKKFNKDKKRQLCKQQSLRRDALHRARGSAEQWKTINKLMNRTDKTECTLPPDTVFNHFKNLFAGGHHPHFDRASKLANDIRAERIDNQANPEGDHLLHDLCTPEEIEPVKVDLLKGMGTSAGIDRVKKKDLFWIDNEQICDIFNDVLRSGEFPKPWLQATLVCLPKKGHIIEDATNIRGIALQSCFLKMFTNFLAKRLFRWAQDNSLIRDSQNAYLPGHRGTNNLFVLRSAIERAKADRKPLYVAYVDLKKAFDLVDRNVLWASMAENGATGRLFHSMRKLYKSLQFRVTLNGKYSGPFSPNTGVLQGDSLSPLLFIIYLSSFRTTNHPDDVRLDGLPIHDLLQADDVALLSHSKQGLQHHLDSFGHFCTHKLAVPNILKTFAQCFNAPKPIDAASSSGLFLTGEQIAWATRQKWVGVTVDMHQPLQWLSHINESCKKIQRAIGAYFSLSSRLGHTPQVFSINHFKAYIRPHFDYAAELLFDLPDYQRKHFEKILNPFLRRVLRLPYQSLIPPLYIETGLDDIEHRWAKQAISFLEAAQALPPSNPTRRALQDSISLQERGRGCIYRLRSKLARCQFSQDFPEGLLTITWASDAKDALTRHFAGKLHIDMQTKQMAPYYKKMPMRYTPQAYLRHPCEEGRFALTLFRTGHSHLQYRTSLHNDRIDGQIRDQSCRYCESEKEDEMHAFFDCEAEEVQPALLAFHTELDRLRAAEIITFSDLDISPDLLECLFLAEDMQVVNMMVRAAKRIGSLFNSLDPRRKTFKPRTRREPAVPGNARKTEVRKRRIIESDSEYTPRL